MDSGIRTCKGCLRHIYSIHLYGQQKVWCGTSGQQPGRGRNGKPVPGTSVWCTCLRRGPGTLSYMPAQRNVGAPQNLSLI